jgi:TRAP-type uncharacterized transport system substrate-binding protein
MLAGEERMSRSRVAFLLSVLCLSLAASSQFAHAQAQKTTRAPTQRASEAVSYEEKKRQTNDIALNIVVSGITCTCARFAEDIRNVVNDLRPDGQRVLPVIGVGGLQNLNDVLFLKGIDMGVVDEDNARLLKKRDPQLYANIEQRVQYITKLYNSEFQVVARNDIRSYDDLRGKKVNFNLKDSQTEVTADIVFNALNLDVERSNYDNDDAIKRLLRGELAAMIILTGAPQAALAKLKKEDGVHFLPLDRRSLPGYDLRQIFADYLPANLTSEQYPALIPEGTTVPTIANRALLVAYAWPEDSQRYKRIAKFIDAFFGKIDQFHDAARHPKWNEVNLAAEIPGWTRFKPAADWLAAHRVVAEARDHVDAVSSSLMRPDLKTAFEEFMDNYTASGRRPLTTRDQEALFTKFEQFLRTKSKAPATR